MEIRQVKGKSAFGSIEVATRTRKKLPRKKIRRGGTRYRIASGQVRFWEENWQQEMLDQVFPVGPYLNINELAKQMAVVAADVFNGHYDLGVDSDDDWYEWHLRDWDDFFPQTKALVEECIGHDPKGSDMVRLNAMEEAQKAHDMVMKITDHFRDPDGLKMLLYSSRRPGVAKLVLSMIERLGSADKINEQGIRIGRLARAKVPTVIMTKTALRAFENHFGAPPGALAMSEDTEAAATMAASAMFAWRGDKSRKAEANIIARLTSHQAAKDGLRADWRAWKLRDVQFERLAATQEMAERLGAKRHIHFLEWSSGIPDLDDKQIELARGLYLAIRRRWFHPFLIEWLLKLVDRAGMAAKSLLSYAGQGEAAMRHAVNLIPERGLKQWQMEEIANAENPIETISEVVKWDGFM